MKVLTKSFGNLISKWWFPWLIAGLIIRIVLMPITLHRDLWGNAFDGYFLAYEGKWNLYDTIVNLPQSHPLIRTLEIEDVYDILVYPPLTYATLGFFQLLLKPFVDPTFIPWLMDNLDRVYFHPQFFKHLFLFKLPYLFIDLAAAFLLASLFTDPRKKKLAFALWIFNPVTFYTTFMIGQFDIIPVFFSILGTYFAYQNKKVLALLSLGIGGSYKMYPLLLIPPAALILAPKFRERLKLVILGFLPFLLTIAPFLTSSAFRAMIISGSKGQKMLFMGWPVSGAEVIFPFVVILFFFYLFAYYYPRKEFLNLHFLAILLLTFSVTHYHPQWFLWITPFLIWELVHNNFQHWLMVAVLFFCWLIISLFFDASLNYGLFNPLWPWLREAPNLSEILGKYTDVYQLKSVIRSIFAGTFLFYVGKLLIFAKKEHV